MANNIEATIESKILEFDVVLPATEAVVESKELEFNLTVEE